MVLSLPFLLLAILRHWAGVVMDMLSFYKILDLSLRLYTPFEHQGVKVRKTLYHLKTDTAFKSRSGFRNNDWWGLWLSFWWHFSGGLIFLNRHDTAKLTLNKYGTYPILPFVSIISSKLKVFDFLYKFEAKLLIRNKQEKVLKVLLKALK